MFVLGYREEEALMKPIMMPIERTMTSRRCFCCGGGFTCHSSR